MWDTLTWCIGIHEERHRDLILLIDLNAKDDDGLFPRIQSSHVEVERSRRAVDWNLYDSGS